MKHVTPFRIAAGLLAVFCALHTAGGMLSQKSMGPSSDAVFAAMKSVHFDFNGSDSTWYGFWFGFGLMASAFLAMSAFVAWRLERVRAEAWPDVSAIAWALTAAQAVTAFLSWKYFFAGPGVFATLATVLLAVGIVRKQRKAVVNPSISAATT
jgi:hypothetical protein